MTAATTGTPGFGVSISFSTGFCAMITNVDWDGTERPSIDVSNNSIAVSGGTGIAGAKLFTPGLIYDPGKLTVELLFDPNTAPPITGAAETITVTLPKTAGQTVGATWAASGFLESFKFGAPMEDKMTASAVLKFSGPITITSGS